MTDAYVWLTPLAVLAVLLLVSFVGCDLVFPLDDAATAVYPDAVLPDAPVAYWRLQETPATTTVPGGAAADETGNHDGTYFQALAVIQPDAPSMSPGANPLILEIGVTGLVATEPSFTALHVQGAGVEVPFSSELNPAQFTLEAFVAAEWDINNASARGNYYCVIESSNAFDAGSGLRKSEGFALYAGPDDPTTPDTPYRWQLWVGDGSAYRQLKEATPNDGTLVTGDPTYLAVLFDGASYTLFVMTQNADLDMVKHALVPVPYVPNGSGDLSIGFTGRRRALVGPAPGPDRVIYPFSGKIQEVAIYKSALAEPRIFSHIGSAFMI